MTPLNDLTGPLESYLSAAWEEAVRVTSARQLTGGASRITSTGRLRCKPGSCS